MAAAQRAQQQWPPGGHQFAVFTGGRKRFLAVFGVQVMLRSRYCIQFSPAKRYGTVVLATETHLRCGFTAHFLTHPFVKGACI
jgi:hypothetical protein